LNIFADQISAELEKTNVLRSGEAYNQIVERLRENAEYISIMGHSNDNLNGLVTYNDSE